MFADREVFFATRMPRQKTDHNLFRRSGGETLRGLCALRKGAFTMTISEKVAYLKGLAEGLNIDTDKSKEGKLINVMIGILEEVALSIEDLEENSLALGEEIDVLSDDLADVESVVFDDEEDEDEDEEEFDDDWFEVECPNCDEVLVVDEDALAEGYIKCPNCDTEYSLDLTDDVVEADEE